MEKAADDEDMRRVVGSFRARNRTVRIAVVLNACLVIAGLGVPYVRGRMRAVEARANFSAFAACLLGGKRSSAPGLAMPRGYRAHFAARYLSTDTAWPGTCDASLRAVSTPSAIFLWPAAKRASADVRATVELMQRELAGMTEARSAGRDLPVRPLRALEKMRAAQTLLAQAAGEDAHLDEDAVRLGRADPVVTPSRLPLHAGTPAALTLWHDVDGLHALATDRRGISLLRVASGEIERTRLRRSGLIRGGLIQRGRPWLAWATSRSRCATLEGGCSRRAMGLASLSTTQREAPDPIWLAGHPLEPLERSVRIGVDQGPITPVWLLAQTPDDSAFELREFALPASAPTDTPPLPPTARMRYRTQGAVRLAAMLPGSPPDVFSMAESGRELLATRWSPDRTPTRLRPSPGIHPWMRTCQAGATRWLAYGSEGRLNLSADGDRPKAAKGAEVTNAANVAKAGAAPRAGTETHSRPPGPPPVDFALKLPAPGGHIGESLWLGCGQRVASVIYLAKDFSLRLLRCTRDACGSPLRLAKPVVSFDAARAPGGEITVATTGGIQFRQVRVHNVSPDGELRRGATPAACVEDEGGLCGPPVLIWAGRRLLLGARDGTDLLVMQSQLGQQGWTALDELNARPAGGAPAGTPMRQHRVRKGL